MTPKKVIFESNYTHFGVHFMRQTSNLICKLVNLCIVLIYLRSNLSDFYLAMRSQYKNIQSIRKVSTFQITIQEGYWNVLVV